MFNTPRMYRYEEQHIMNKWFVWSNSNCLLSMIDFLFLFLSELFKSKNLSLVLIWPMTSAHRSFFSSATIFSSPDSSAVSLHPLLCTVYTDTDGTNEPFLPCRIILLQVFIFSFSFFFYTSANQPNYVFSMMAHLDYLF